MADIFISYARSDRTRAERLAQALGQQGWAVWWDRDIPPGKTFDEVIEEALAGATCVIVLWSQASVGSEWVKAEASEAARRRILVPILADDVRIPLEFRRIQAARLADWENLPANQDWDQLERALATLVGGPINRPIKTPDTGGPAPDRPPYRPFPVAGVAAGTFVLLSLVAGIFYLRPETVAGADKGPTSTHSDSAPVPTPLPSAGSEDKGPVALAAKGTEGGTPAAPATPVASAPPPARSTAVEPVASGRTERPSAAVVSRPPEKRPDQANPKASTSSTAYAGAGTAVPAATRAAADAPAPKSTGAVTGDESPTPTPMPPKPENRRPVPENDQALFDVIHTRGVFREQPGRLNISTAGVSYEETGSQGARAGFEVACGDIRKIETLNMIGDPDQRMMRLRLRDREYTLKATGTATRNAIVAALSRACGPR